MGMDVNRDAELRLKVDELCARIDDLQRRIAEVMAKQRQLAEDLARAQNRGVTHG